MFRTLIYPSSGVLSSAHVAGWNTTQVVLQPATRALLKTQLHQICNTQRTENKTTDVVIQQHSRKLLVVDILMLETCWAHKKWNKIASDFKLVFYSSTITMMHGPINIRFFRSILPLLEHCWILHNWCKSTVIKTPLSCCLLCSDSSHSLYLLNLEILLCRHHPLKLRKTELTINESIQIVVCTCKPAPTYNVEARTKRRTYARALIRGQVRLEGRWGLPVCTPMLVYRSM